MNGLNIKDKIEISSGDALIHSRIERLLFTEREERAGRLSFGSLIPQLFYEPADPDLLADVLREIQFLFENYEKELILSSLTTEIISEGDLLGMLIKIECLNLEFLKVRSL